MSYVERALLRVVLPVAITLIIFAFSAGAFGQGHPGGTTTPATPPATQNPSGIGQPGTNQPGMNQPGVNQPGAATPNATPGQQPNITNPNTNPNPGVTPNTTLPNRNPNTPMNPQNQRNPKGTTPDYGPFDPEC